MTEINKVVYNGETLIDLTEDTVTEADVASGKTFHAASGEQKIGTLIPAILSGVGDRTGCVEIGNLLLQWGYHSAAPSGSETVKSWSHTVTFEKAYKYNPIVMATVSNSATGTTMRATATSIATGSFVLNVQRNSTSNTIALWLAVGEKA